MLVAGTAAVLAQAPTPAAREPKKIHIVNKGALEGIELEPGADAWIRVKFPESAKGEWEIGCFVPGHYEAGMKGRIVVEAA